MAHSNTTQPADTMATRAVDGSDVSVSSAARHSAICVQHTRTNTHASVHDTGAGTQKGCQHARVCVRPVPMRSFKQ